MNLLIGTNEFQYASVKYSGAQKPPRSVVLDKLEIGFSQWGAINASFNLNRHDGYKMQRPTDYDSLLDDASQIPVILYDTSQRRATQTNAEIIILHILLHGQSQGESTANMTSPVDRIDGANPDRKLQSTRETMKANSDRVIDFRAQLGRPGDKAVLFKDEVERLHLILDALWEKTLPGSTATEIWKPSFSQHRLNGWEYLSLVNSPNAKYLPPRSVDLGGSNGGWHQYAKDVRALVLFGSDFGDTYCPTMRDSLCPGCLQPPRGDCSLAIRTDVVNELFEQQGCHQDRARLTDNGWTLQASEDPFKPCSKKCQGIRTVALVQRLGRGKSKFVHQLPENGVMILGKVTPSFHTRVFGRILPPGLKHPSKEMLPPLTAQGRGPLRQVSGCP